MDKQAIQAQVPYEITDSGNDTQVLAAPGTFTWPTATCRGHTQLAAHVRNAGANPLTVTVQTSKDQITAWDTVHTVLIAAGAFNEFVIDLLDNFVRVTVTTVLGTTAHASLRLLPVGAMESTRAAAAPDVVDLNSLTTIHQNAANAVGNGTDAVLDASYGLAKIQIISTAGIIAATLQFFVSENGVNFIPLLARNVRTNSRFAQVSIGASANDMYEADVAGYQLLRVRLDAINPAAGVPTVTVSSTCVQGASPTMEDRIDKELVVDGCNAITGWAGNAQVANLAIQAAHVRGTNSLSFDKIAGGTTALIEKTLPAPVDASMLKEQDLVGWVAFLSDITNVAYCFVRLGTNNANYSEWRLNDEDIAQGRWNSAKMSLAGVEPAVAGTGCIFAAISYVAFGVEFDAAGNVLAGIRVDEITLSTSYHSTAQLNAEISTEISSPNVNLARVADTPTPTGLGALGAGVLRVGALIHDGVRTLTVALRGLASTGLGILKMLEYRAVPPAVADGQMVPAQSNAFGQEEIAAFSRLLQALKVIEQAPPIYDVQPGPIRLSAALPAAGALDVPVPIPTGRIKYAYLHIDYTQGAAGGGFRLFLETCITVGGVDMWSPKTEYDAGVFAQGVYSVLSAQGVNGIRLFSTVGTLEPYQVSLPLGGADKFRVSFAEIGVTATPGTLGAWYKLSNNEPGEQMFKADSKAYTAATDSGRGEEINPVDTHGVGESLVDTTNVGAGTNNYPSAAGAAVSIPYNNVTATGKFIDADGTVTLTIWATDDEDVAAGDWIQQVFFCSDIDSKTWARSVTNGTMLFSVDMSQFHYRYVRFRVVTSGATNTIIIKYTRSAM